MVNQAVIDDFIDAIKPEEAKNPSGSVHSAIVSKIDKEGTIWVTVAGSDTETPTASTSSEVKRGDSVNVEWRNNKLYIAGNYSNPAAGASRVNAVEVAAQVANQAASQAVADAGVAKNAATEARAIVDELEGDVDNLGSRVSTAESNITTVEGNITSLGGRVTTAEGNITSLGGRVTTAEGKVTTIEGDIASLGNRVTAAEGDISTAEGNISDLQSRVTTAEGDINSVEGDITSLGTRVTTAEGKITTAEGNITSIGNRVTTAEGKITTAEGNITSLGSRITTAEGKVTTAEGNITNLQGRIADAEEDIGDVEAGLVRAQEDIQAAADSAEQAGEYAARALGNLSTVQNVTETLNWITAHGTMTLTSDVALDPTHVYFVRDNNGDYHVGSYYYSVVTDPNVDDIATYYELSIDESLNNYVATHLAVDSEGLWIVPDSGGNRVLIATGGNGHTYDPAGTYVIGKANNVDTVLAKFLSSGAQIGAANSGNVWIDSDGIDIKNGATVHAEFSDQRIVLGKAPTQDGDRQWEFTRDYGIAKMYEVRGSEEFPEYEDYAGFYVGNRTHGGATWLLGAHFGSYPNIAGDGSVGIGYFPQPTGTLSVAIGTVVAGGDYQTAIGRFNDNQNDTVFEIGNGDSPTSASNAFTVDWDGNIEASGDVTDGSGNVLSNKADASSLATVATSGSYTDLTNKPTLFSGDYNDLTNKPTIPTVNNATLTIQKNGSTVKTFTANASSNVTANITVPTKVSDLTNDSGYITGYTETDPVFLASAAHGITSSDITNWNGKSNFSGSYNDLTDKPTLFSGNYNDLTNKPTIPTVNNATLTIQKNGTNVETFTANASANKTANITVPTKTSDITNDSGFIVSPNVPYCTCATAAGTAAKTTTIVSGTFNESDLVAGAQVLVKFTNANSVASPTLKIGSTTAKAIRRYGTTAPSTSAASSWNAGAIVLFIYDGTYWFMENWINTTYSSMTVAEYEAGTGTTARLITPERLKAAIQTWSDSGLQNIADTADGVGVTGNVEASGDVISGTANKNLAYTGEYVQLIGNKDASKAEGQITLTGQGSYANCLPSGKYDTEQSPKMSDLASVSDGAVTILKAGRYKVHGQIYMYSGYTANDYISCGITVNNAYEPYRSSRFRVPMAGPYTVQHVDCIISANANDALRLVGTNQGGARGLVGISGYTRMSVECLGIYE